MPNAAAKTRSCVASKAVKRAGKSHVPASPWQTRLQQKKDIKRVILDKDFAGIRKGSMLLVATPAIFEAYLCKIPSGQTRSIERVRNELARQHKADATCPVTTAICLRVVAEAAWDELQAGKSLAEVAPFWRAIDPDTPLAKRLRVGSQSIRDVRASETGSSDGDS